MVSLSEGDLGHDGWNLHQGYHQMFLKGRTKSQIQWEDKVKTEKKLKPEPQRCEAVHSEKSSVQTAFG